MKKPATAKIASDLYFSGAIFAVVGFISALKSPPVWEGDIFVIRLLAASA